jgi:hypothetical protein
MEREKVEFIESYIKVQGGDYQWNDNHGELIRCRDCRYYDGTECLIKKGWFPVQPDWYCADGKRKEQDK